MSAEIGIRKISAQANHNVNTEMATWSTSMRHR